MFFFFFKLEKCQGPWWGAPGGVHDLDQWEGFVVTLATPGNIVIPRTQIPWSHFSVLIPQS